jgi:2-polyprenyl-3-methyl-5-hydroxy-6-metoxy-1,4-benzoquinol methylase
MSEDTDAKTGGRRRRTTRAGRRRAGSRAPGEPAEPGSAEQWSPAWRADAEALPADAVEEVEEDDASDALSDDAEGEGDCAAVVQGGAAAEPAEDGDKRPTREIVVTPFTLAELQEEEKTNPRIRVGDMGPQHPAELEPSSAPAVTFWSRPSTRFRADSEESSVVAVRPAVIITPSRVISDYPPAMHPAKAAEVVARAEPAPRVPAPPRSPPPPPPPPRAPEPAPPVATSFEQFDELPEPVAATIPAEPEPEVAELEDVAPVAEPSELGAEPEAAAAPQSAPAADEGGLQIVDVDVAELEHARRSRTPPPPPPDARGKAAPPKRPPPPPASSKGEDDRQKRKQARQWWERFFSDDYLMSVRPATAAQIARQVDFIEQSLGIGKGGTILDVGCGLGLHAVELTRRGYLVVGLDLSLAMITRAAELAQQHQLKLNVVHADIREMEFDGAFDGVICMGTTFGFFDDDANRDMLARLHQALRPGGRLLLDMVNRDYVIGFQPNLVWFEGDECVCMEESDFNYFNSRLTVKRTLMREDGKQSNAEYSVRLYSLHELGTFMQQVGFRVIEVSGQEAIRGAFFGSNSPRVLMLSERRAAGRPSAVMPPEPGRASTAMPPERGSAEIPKIPKPE